jgi:hypothetical protein
MALTAASIIQRAVGTLQDTTSVRWPADELVRYLNDGQREVVIYRPDASVANETVTCTTGSKQTLPADATKLIDVVRNAAVASAKGPVRMINRTILDAQIPDWHAQAGSVDILHFMYDARDPLTFYTYPPALPTASLDIVVSKYPVDVVEPASGELFSDVAGDIGIPDIYGNVLLDYVLYRAYTKDAEYAGNAARAQAHYNAFAASLGIEIKGTIGIAPNPTGSPLNG